MKTYTGNRIAALYLTDADGNDPAELASMYLNTPQAGVEYSASFTWALRQTAVAGGRTLPIPPSSFPIYLQIGYAGLSDPTAFYVVANTYDQDGDDISDVVEDENNGVNGQPVTPNWGGFNYNSIDYPPLISTTISSSDNLYPNRGTHDYSIAKGTRGSGTLLNGLRIANQSTGYRYFENTDTPDTDNWGTLELINVIEQVARSWGNSNPNYPITTLDISLQNGGYFDPHNGHQNGLDIDIMYIGTGSYQYGTFIEVGTSNYNQIKSQQLLQLFAASPKVYRVWTSDTQIANLSSSDKIYYLGGHIDHFHVDFYDPDGEEN